MMAPWTTMEVMCISAIETIQTVQGIIWCMTAGYTEILVNLCNSKGQTNWDMEYVELSSYWEYKGQNTNFNWLKQVDFLKPIWLPVQLFRKDIGKCLRCVPSLRTLWEIYQVWIKLSNYANMCKWNEDDKWCLGPFIHKKPTILSQLTTSV